MYSNSVEGLLQSALAHHRVGNLDQADSLYQQLLQFDPRHPDALHLRGVIAHQRGDHTSAVRAIEAALAVSPGNPMFLNNLGLCYQQLGRLNEAMGAYQTALQGDPRQVEAMVNLGIVFNQQGRLAESEEWCRRALAINPGSADAHNCLGSALSGQERLPEAIACFHAALAIEPRLTGAMVNLGNALCKAGRPGEAEPWCRRAIELDPSLAQAQNALALTLTALGRMDQAIAAFHDALALAPGRADVHHNLGHAYGQLGQFDKAREAYEAALRLAPHEVKTYYSLSLIHRFTPADQPLVSQVEAALSREGLPAFDRRQLHFALGKAYDDMGQYDRAFPHFRKGNELARREFDRQAAARHVGNLTEYFTPARLTAPNGSGNLSPLPVFIVGVPRSGTSLVEQMLASHPEVYGCGELRDMNEIAAASNDGFPTPAMPPLGPERWAAWAEEYLGRRRALCAGALRVTDKMPTNYLHLGLIALLFPAARVIHCRRDPLDTCLSCYFTDFKDSPAYHYRLDDLGFCYRLYLRVMEHWRTVLPMQMLEVDYEELVAHPETEARRMVEFCGLPWDDRCLRYYENRRPVRTSSIWQVRQPIYRNAVGRWRHYLRHLQPLLRELGPAAGEGATAAFAALSAGVADDESDSGTYSALGGNGVR